MRLLLTEFWYILIQYFQRTLLIINLPTVIATYHAYINLPMGIATYHAYINLPTGIPTYHADNQHTYGILMYRTGK